MNIYIILSFTILLGLVVWGMIDRKALRCELAKERQEHINLIRTYETFRAYHEQYEKESIKWDAVDFVHHGEWRYTLWLHVPGGYGSLPA